MNRLVFATILLIGVSGSAFADSFAVQKNGPCPTGYNASGNYCVPRSNESGQAVARTGSCPTGFNASGGFCVAREPKSFAVQRTGSCPTGYNASGNYCVKR